LGKTLQEIGGMSVVEYQKWIKYEYDHPFPRELSDLHFAMLSSIIVNVNRSSDTPPVEMLDFLLLKRSKPAEEPEVAEVSTEAKKFAAALRG
jgi:hypothetical protein